jgi:hypothetical protein
MCERVRSRPGRTDHAPRPQMVFAERPTCPHWTNHHTRETTAYDSDWSLKCIRLSGVSAEWLLIRHPDNEFALLSASRSQAEGQLGLEGLSRPTECAYWRCWISQVECTLTLVAHNRSACRSWWPLAAALRFPGRRGAGTQDLHRDSYSILHGAPIRAPRLSLESMPTISTRDGVAQSCAPGLRQL